MVNIPLHGDTDASYVAMVEEFDGNPDLADALSCEMCQALVGLATGDGEIPSRFTLYYLVHLAGDSADTYFCEDCYGWLADAAPHITAFQPTLTQGAS